MLIRFSVENWMSFANLTSFSMIASRERQHKERIAFIDKYKLGILPVAAIYGGNASGKTNFFKGLWFAKNLVVKGTQPDALIPIDTFRLDVQKAEQPVRFEFELLIDSTIYALSFVVTHKAVLEEKLVQILAASEKVLYHRKDGKPNLDKSIADDKALNFVFKGTRDNQLFLTNAVSQNIQLFRPLYDWFKDTLELVRPDTQFGPFEQFFDEDHPLATPINSMLAQLDTGIDHLGFEKIPFESLPLPQAFKMKLQEELTEGKATRVVVPQTNERFVVTRKHGELVAKKLVTYHRKSDGTEVKFEMRQESEGSQRVIDLLPAFIELSEAKANKVYVIDELDRHLHTLLTRHLLEGYLATCSSMSRTQLLFTTHDALLMDQDLLRRDEMWIAERDSLGASRLVSFSEYKDVRYDKDIRKSYLQGRLGGIPRLLLKSSKPS